MPIMHKNQIMKNGAKLFQYSRLEYIPYNIKFEQSTMPNNPVKKHK